MCGRKHAGRYGDATDGDVTDGDAGEGGTETYLGGRGYLASIYKLSQTTRMDLQATVRGAR